MCLICIVQRLKLTVAFSHCEIVNAVLQVSLTSDVIALEQSVDKTEFEFSCLPADDLTSMLATLVVSDL
jgi:hypothetical protein